MYSMSPPPCRLCGPSTDATRVAQEIADQLRWETDLAEPEVRDRRLEVCRGCSRLVGATCADCGCYVEFRAAIGGKSCPRGLWAATA